MRDASPRAGWVWVLGWMLLVAGCGPGTDGFAQGDDDDASGDDDVADDDTGDDDDGTPGDDDDGTPADDDDGTPGDDDDGTPGDDDDGTPGDDDTTAPDGTIEGTVDEGLEAPGGSPPWTLCVDAFDDADWDPQGGPQELPVASATLTVSALPIAYSLTYTPGAPVRVWAFVDEDASGCITGPGYLEPMGIHAGTVTVPAYGIALVLDSLHSH